MGFADVLFCPTGVDRALADVAKAVFDLLNVADYQERESSNYIDGHYFVAEICDAKLTIALTDDAQNEDLPYWLHATSHAIENRALNDWLDERVRACLLPARFRAARMIHYGRLDREIRVDYIGPTT